MREIRLAIIVSTTNTRAFLGEIWLLLISSTTYPVACKFLFHTTRKISKDFSQEKRFLRNTKHHLGPVTRYDDATYKDSNWAQLAIKKWDNLWKFRTNNAKMMTLWYKNSAGCPARFGVCLYKSLFFEETIKKYEFWEVKKVNWEIRNQMEIWICGDSDEFSHSNSLGPIRTHSD